MLPSACRTISAGSAAAGSARLVRVEVAIRRRAVAAIRVGAELVHIGLRPLDLLLRHQVGHVDDADAVVRVERRHLVARALEQPRLQVASVAVQEALRARCSITLYNACVGSRAKGL
jgi:hypothetical protein